MVKYFAISGTYIWRFQHQIHPWVDTAIECKIRKIDTKVPR